MTFLTVAEAARLWGVSERTVRNYCADGRIPGAELIGKTWAVPEGAERPGRRPRTQTKPRALLQTLCFIQTLRQSQNIQHPAMR